MHYGSIVPSPKEPRLKSTVHRVSKSSVESDNGGEHRVKHQLSKHKDTPIEGILFFNFSFLLFLLFFFTTFVYRNDLASPLLGASAEPIPYAESSGAADRRSQHSELMSESPPLPHVESPAYDRDTGELLDPLFVYDHATRAPLHSDSPIPDGTLKPSLFLLSFFFFFLLFFIYHLLI